MSTLSWPASEKCRTNIHKLINLSQCDIKLWTSSFKGLKGKGIPISNSVTKFHFTCGEWKLYENFVKFSNILKRIVYIVCVKSSVAELLINPNSKQKKHLML